MKVQTYDQIFGRPLTVRDLFDGFKEDTKTGGVTAFGGKLNVRPPYQREFIYGDDKRNAVINTVLNQFPLNTMYWAKLPDGTYELMDGQQRTISICKYCCGQFSIDIDLGGKRAPKNFDNLGDRKEIILNYPLTVYICDGTEEEKLAWFQIINIAGVRLTEQEMRNAIYSGPWVTAAKKYFSRDDGEACLSEGETSNGHTYGDYLAVDHGKNSESPSAVVRQKLLEIVLGWAANAYNVEHDLKNNDAITIENFMDANRSKTSAMELWRYYQDVMEWVRTTFPEYNSDMKRTDWGNLYNEYKNCTPVEAMERVKILRGYADELKNTNGIYKAALSGDMKYLNAREFDKADKKWAHEKQKHICPYCHGVFELNQMHGDHIRPWSKGGKTERANLQMLCMPCNLKKSSYDNQYSPLNESIYESFDLAKWDGKE